MSLDHTLLKAVWIHSEMSSIEFEYSSESVFEKTAVKLEKNNINKK